MSKIISIDCDARELRIAVGNSGLTGVSVEHLLSAPLDVANSEDVLDNPKTQAALQILLKQANVKSANAIVCMPRGAVELRTVQVPTADKNELPDMVRFAALRSFANVGESWPIDFVQLGTNSEGMTEVLASSINPSRIERIQKMLEPNGLKMGHLVLRPMVASAVALLKRTELQNECTLFVDMLSQEADMAIVDGKHVVFMRTIRFDADQDASSRLKTLGSEIKRTLLSAVSQNSELQVTRVILWGSANQVGSVCEGLETQLKLPVLPLDPLDLVEATSKLKSDTAEQSGKFASTIGALLAPSFHEHLIDFTNPRKREEKQSPVRLYALAGSIAALVLGYLVFSYFSTNARLNADLQSLTEKKAGNTENVKTALAKDAEWKKIETFLANNYSWLDELEYLSEHSLSPDEAIFNKVNFATDNRGTAASITATYESIDQDKSTQIQNLLRDDKHSVKSKGLKPGLGQSQQFPWNSDVTIALSGNKVEDPRKWKSPPPVKSPEPSDAPKSTAASPEKGAPENGSPIQGVEAAKQSAGSAGGTTGVTKEESAIVPKVSESAKSETPILESNGAPPSPTSGQVTDPTPPVSSGESSGASSASSEPVAPSAPVPAATTNEGAPQ